MRGGCRIGYLGDAKESHLSVPLVYSENFAKREKEAGAFMLAYMKGVRVYNDAFVKGKNKEKVIDIMAKYAGVDRKVVGGILSRRSRPRSGYQRQILAGDAELLRRTEDDAEADRPLKLVDTSFAKAALAKLGPY